MNRKEKIESLQKLLDEIKEDDLMKGDVIEVWEGIAKPSQPMLGYFQGYSDKGVLVKFGNDDCVRTFEHHNKWKNMY